MKNLTVKRTLNQNHKAGVTPPSLFNALWRGKWSIIITIILSTLLAALCAFVILPPTYRSESTVTPPFAYQMSALNEGLMLYEDLATLTSDLQPINPDEVYEIFLQMLTSNEIKNQFFEKHYLPRLKNAEINTKDMPNTFEGFQDKLIIQPLATNPEFYTLSFSASDALMTRDSINEYLLLADRAAKANILKNREIQITQLISELDTALQNRQAEINTHITNELSKLKNALAVAQKLSMNPPPNQPAELYVQSTKELLSRIKPLEEQQKNYALDAQYRKLTAMIEHYQKIVNLDPKEIKTYDTYAQAQLPRSPIKPQRSLILQLGIALGAIMGVIWVLIRRVIIRNM